MSGSAPGREQRIDQWLWFSRLVKSRTLAQTLIERGKVRVNRLRIDKASHTVKAGDVLTLSTGPHVRVIEVRGIGIRRGPPTEAQLLFVEIAVGGSAGQVSRVRQQASGTFEAVEPAQGARDGGAGRPTKRDRRAIDKLRR